MLKCIPESRLIESSDIDKLSKENIHILMTYYEQKYGKIEYVEIFNDLIKDVFNCLNDGDVLLAPGDSPSKIIQVMKINYEVEPGEFIINGVRKNIKIVSFSLSTAQTTKPSEIDKYLFGILESNNINPNDNLIMIDHTEYGKTYKCIRSSIARYKGINTLIEIHDKHGPDCILLDDVLPFIVISTTDYIIKLILKKMDLPSNFRCYYYDDFFEDEYYHSMSKNERSLINNHIKKYEHIFHFICEAELTNSRCVPYNHLGFESIDITSYFNCNVIIFAMAIVNEKYNYLTSDYCSISDYYNI
ncbi:unnamed protein product [marine sediment metagenome]|uniref:Uncharacterized protein n=1 Tax=marine sediment metagenome TaxID=412755 RepID=X0Z263_9ZZZZ